MIRPELALDRPPSRCWRRCAAVAVAWSCSSARPRSAAVRPPKLDYKMTTLPNGLTVVLLEDHSTPIVHAELWYHVGSKNEKTGPHRLRAPLRAHDVQGLEERRARGAHVVDLAASAARATPTPTEDATVFWETVPAQYLPLVLWLEADRMATLRIDERDVRERARGREGRAADAGREPAVRPADRDHLRPGVHDAPLQAPDDRQHGGSRGGVDRRRARLLPAPTTCRRTRR